MQEFPKALDALHANSPRGRSVPVEPDLFGKLAPRQGTREAMGKQWQNLPMPRRSSNLPAGHTVSITARPDSVIAFKNSGSPYTPVLGNDDRGNARRAAESVMYGTAWNEPAENRRVYGYLRSDKNPTPLQPYGSVNMNINPRVLAGATTTAKDSVYASIEDAGVRNGESSVVSFGGEKKVNGEWVKSTPDTAKRAIGVEPLGKDHREGFAPLTQSGRHKTYLASFDPENIEGVGLHDSPGNLIKYREVQMNPGLQWKDVQSLDLVTPDHPDVPAETTKSAIEAAEATSNELRRETGAPVTHSTRVYQPSLFEYQNVGDEWKGEWQQGRTVSSGNTPTRTAEEDLDARRESQHQALVKNPRALTGRTFYWGE